MTDYDPDETEGRKLYRVKANAVASAQINYSRRGKRMAVPMKEGEIYTKGKRRITVTGLYRKVSNGETGVFFRDIDQINSPSYHHACTLIEWTAFGWEKEAPKKAPKTAKKKGLVG